MFFLHLHTNLPSSFQDVARYLFTRICDTEASTIHFISDKWISPSIKDCERSDRADDSDVLYLVNGPAQKRPSDWNSALRSNTFKQSLIRFLTDYWQQDEFAAVLGDKVLYANQNDRCLHYKKKW